MPLIGLQAKLFTQPESLHALAGEWQDLFRRCPGASSFQRPEWVLTWIDVFRPVHPFVIGVWYGSLLVGLAPLLVYQQEQDSVLAFVGGGVSDYLDMLIDPTHLDEALTAIFDVIACHRQAWDKLDFTDLPQNSMLLRKCGGFAVEEHATCAVLQLPSSIEGLSASVSSHKLRNYRNARRRLAEAGKFQVEIATEANLSIALAALFRLHSDRWAKDGQSGVLGRAEVQLFHQRVASRLISIEVLRLYMLRIDGEIIATLYALVESDAVYCYIQGYDPAYSKLSPGTFILGAVIEDSVRHWANRIDFLRGRESYKLSWGAQEVPTFRARISKSRFATLTAPLDRTVSQTRGE
jgi:CelD/BcsL family acetyltransferase involved in cellulose biosynthesis